MSKLIDLRTLNLNLRLVFYFLQLFLLKKIKITAQKQQFQKFVLLI